MKTKKQKKIKNKKTFIDKVHTDSDFRKEHDKGFTEGLWYAVQQVLIFENEPEIARGLINESGTPEWEFRKAQDENGFENERMYKFLDEVFEKEDGEEDCQ